MFIQTESTPNPATLKFLPGRTVLADGAIEITNADSAGVSPLARALFSIEGVTGVMFGNDFISVTKRDGEWQHLKPAILGAIMEHYVSGLPLLENPGAAQGDDFDFFDLGHAGELACGLGGAFGLLEVVKQRAVRGTLGGGSE